MSRVQGADRRISLQPLGALERRPARVGADGAGELQHQRGREEDAEEHGEAVHQTKREGWHH